jgi:hypothetical protein
MRLRWGSKRRFDRFMEELEESAAAVRRGEALEWRSQRGRPRDDPRVAIDDERVSVATDTGAVEEIRWDRLRRVEFKVLGGVGSPGDYWVLEDDDGGCVVPSSSASASALLDRLQELPGFDDGAVMDAILAGTPGAFVCWVREDGPEPST